MMKKYMRIVSFASIIAVLTACGGSVKLADGSYEGTSSVYTNPDGSDAGNGDGTEKGADYGKKQGSVANRDFYNKAQKAVKACDEYAKLLVQSGNPDDIDAISGATINHDQFVEAAKIALDSAKAK